MIKRRIKWNTLVLSILFGMVLIVAPNSFSVAEEGRNTSIVETDNKIQDVAPAAGVMAEPPVKKSPHFDQAHAKEKIEKEADALPESLDKTNFVLTEEMMAKSVEKFDEYSLGPEDRIKVTVFGESELTGDYRVGSDGTIAFPLIGDINVEGLTLRQAEEAIETKLREGYLKKPSVSIEVSESRPFYILGEVRRPGSYNYVAGMSVLQAVAISGGFTYRANRKNVEILRGNEAPAEPMNAAPSEKVKPGDIIFIQERFF